MNAHLFAHWVERRAEPGEYLKDVGDVYSESFVVLILGENC